MNNFFLEIENIFTLTGRGTVAVGYANGTIHIGDKINIFNKNKQFVKSTVIFDITNIDKKESKIETGDKIGLFLRCISKDEIKRGYIISK